MKHLMVIAGWAALSGCVTVTHELAEEIHYRETDRVNHFLDYELSCRRKGGILIVRTTGRLGGARVPRRADSYGCSRSARSMIRR